MKTTNDDILFNVRVVYGFLHKLEIVLLGEVLDGEIEDDMVVQVRFEGGTVAGTWEIMEVLHMDFLNQKETSNFKGVMLRCKNEEDFKLLQSLRVYNETIYIVPQQTLKPINSSSKAKLPTSF